MPDPALKLNVEVAGAQKGVADLNAVAAATDKTAQAAEKTAPANQKAAVATKSLGDALSGLGSRNNDAKDVLEGVSAAAKGGEGALFGVAKAARAAFAVFAGGPIGIAVAALALLGTTALALADKFGPAKKSAEELAKEIDEAKKRADDLSKVRIEQLTHDLDAAKKEATDAAQALDEVLAAQQRIADANKNSALAQNRNDDSITEAERTRREFAINDRFAKNDDERKITSLQGREKIAGQTLGRDLQANEQNEVAYRRKLEEVNALQAKQQRLSDIETGQVSITGDDEAGIANQYTELQSEAARLKREIAALKPEVLQKEFNDLQATTQKGRDAIFVAEKELAAATKKLADERKVQGEITKAREAEVSSNQLKAIKEATKTDLEKAKQRKTTTEEQQKLAREIDEAQSAGDYSKQDELAAEYRRRQKLIDLEGPAPKAEKTPLTPQKVSTFAPKEKTAGIDQAAQEIKSAEPVDAQPAADAVKEVATALQEKNAEGNANIQQAASTIRESATAIPVPVDVSPVAQEFAGYHGAVVNRFQQSDQKIAELARQLALMRQQIQQAANASR